MADTITIGGGMIQIVPAAGGMSNFDAADYFPNGIYCSGINFVGADTDVLKIRNKSATGVFLEPGISGSVSRQFYPPQRCMPYILASDQTMAASENCVITMYFV